MAAAVRNGSTEWAPIASASFRVRRPVELRISAAAWADLEVRHDSASVFFGITPARLVPEAPVKKPRCRSAPRPQSRRRKTSFKGAAVLPTVTEAEAGDDSSFEQFQVSAYDLCDKSNDARGSCGAQFLKIWRSPRYLFGEILRAKPET